MQNLKKAVSGFINILKGFQMQRPRIDIERAKYFTESMRQTEGEHLTLRWAKALKNIAENITVYIDDHQLLVGRSGHQGRYGILYPELDGDFLDLAVEQLSQRTQSPCDISAEDGQVVIDEIAPYWKGKTYHEALATALPEETVRYTFDPKDPLMSRFIVNETSSFRSSLQWVHDYEKALKKGFKRLKQEAQERLHGLDPFSPVDNVEKKPFLEAIIILCDAIVIWAKRHSRLAKKMAAKEKDPQRKAELRGDRPDLQQGPRTARRNVL